MPNEQNQAVALSALNIPVNGGWSNDHDAWSIIWIRQGQAAFEPGINLELLKPRDVLVVPSGNVVGFKADSSVPIVGFSLTFYPAYLPCSVAGGTRVLLQNASQGRHDPAVLPNGNRLLPLLDALAGERCSPPLGVADGLSQVLHACPCPLVSRLNAIIDELLRTVKGVQNSNGDISQRLLGILGGLQQKELQSITIDELARRCGCSRRHLARLIREQCGDSLSAIVNGVKLERAAELLLDPNRKIVDVAPDCGFNHLGAFSKRFRERFGLTPAAWRKQKLGLKDTNGVPLETPLPGGVLSAALRGRGWSRKAGPGEVDGTAQRKEVGKEKPEPAKATGKPPNLVRRGVMAHATKPRNGKSKTGNAKWAVRKVRSASRSKVKLSERQRRRRKRR